MTRLIVHGHFYQPPRENPWTGRIDRQPGAAPFHDWNERIHAECYRANSFALIVDDEGEKLVNNFERLSFNIGPTLFSWLERTHPKTHERIIAADRASIERLGYGNAIAQSFHHTILPLSPMRDVRTEVRWGLADFRYRFGRDAEGMWLPETAMDEDVLSVLIEEGVAFTVLAQHQADSWREPDGPWVDVQDEPIDPRVPYLFMHPDGSGRSITLFFYDGDIAKRIAFENAMSSASGFLDMFESQAGDGGAVHAATDGETYGHHHKFGDIGLAYALQVEAASRDLDISNYSRWMHDEPATLEVLPPKGRATSWSCFHGVGRWSTDCGCQTRGEPDWNQRWRAPLRSALEIVRHAADEAYERLGATQLTDPWGARDRYVDVVIGARDFEDFAAAEVSGPLPDPESLRSLMELQRYSMSMFTSCAWFFSDVGDIETLQILRYAAKTLDLMDDLGQPTPETAFLAKLEEAESNEPEVGTGADVYASFTHS